MDALYPIYTKDKVGEHMANAR